MSQISHSSPAVRVVQIASLLRLHQSDIVLCSKEIEKRFGFDPGSMCGDGSDLVFALGADDMTCTTKVWGFLASSELHWADLATIMGSLQPKEAQSLLLEIGASLYSRYINEGRFLEAESLGEDILSRLKAEPSDVRLNNLAAFLAFIQEEYDEAVNLSQAAIHDEDPFLQAVGLSNASVALLRSGDLAKSTSLISSAIKVCLSENLPSGVVCHHVERAMNIPGFKENTDPLDWASIEERIVRPETYYDHRMLCSIAFGGTGNLLTAPVIGRAIALARANALGTDIDQRLSCYRDH